MSSSSRRLFFAMPLQVPHDAFWEDPIGKGKKIAPEHRHLTLCFLGDVAQSSYTELLHHLQSVPPTPPFKMGCVGYFDKLLFLPPKIERVVAWHIHFFVPSQVSDYQKTLSHYLANQNLKSDERHLFTPHVTLARYPLHKEEWQKQFHPLPLIATSIDLFESLGHSEYVSRFSLKLIPPFESLEHTADIAYLVRGQEFKELFIHAQIALCFSFPPLIPYLKLEVMPALNSLRDVIVALNECVTRMDIAIGCPFKAVSYHSHMYEKSNLLHWEMIIDV